MGYACVSKLVSNAIKSAMRKAKARARTRQWHADNKDYSVDSQKAYRVANKKKLSAAASRHHVAHREKRLQQMKAYRDDHKAERSDYSKDRRKNDPLFRLTEQARGAVNNMKYRLGTKKSGKTFRLIGKTASELKDYLSAQLDVRAVRPSLSDCEVDHVFPITAFKYDPDATAKAMHWSNLQPLTKEENSDKRAKLPTKEMASKVSLSYWPIGVVYDSLPDKYEGWATALHK